MIEHVELTSPTKNNLFLSFKQSCRYNNSAKVFLKKIADNPVLTYYLKVQILKRERRPPPCFPAADR